MHPVCNQYFTMLYVMIYNVVLEMKIHSQLFCLCLSNYYTVGNMDGLSMIMWITPYQTEHL